MHSVGSQGWDSFRERLTMRYNVAATGGLKFISQALNLFPWPPRSHVDHYRHVAARTGWKYLCFALSSQHCVRSLQISPTRACIRTWLQHTFTCRKWQQGKKSSFQKTNKVLWIHKERAGSGNSKLDWGILLQNSPRKLKNIQIGCCDSRCRLTALDCEIIQAELSDRYMWVTGRDAWQLFRPYESAAATGKQKLKWKFLEEAECSIMSVEMATSLSSASQICLSVFLF